MVGYRRMEERVGYRRMEGYDIEEWRRGVGYRRMEGGLGYIRMEGRGRIYKNGGEG